MEKLVILGRGNPTGKNVGITSDARARSTYIIGITGTGKSTLLETMAYQDMANRDGLCFLDPHGDSAKKLLAAVPDYRESDVIFWDPGDIHRPFGFNPFYCQDPTNELEVSDKAQSFLDALASLKEFAAIFESAPRMKNMLQHLATTFIVNQGHTLAETPKFLLDEEYRQQFYPALSKHYARVRQYWEDELDSRSEKERREITESSLNKLERFQSDPVLFHIFGQPTNSIDFRKAMDTGAILIVNLRTDHGGFIGAFVVWEILQAAFSRADIPEADRRPFHLFADEFQTYMTTAFPKLQAQARKYRVDTVIAHQVRAQLTPEIAEITPAVGNLIIFRVTSHNANSLAWEFDTTPPPVEPVSQIVTEPVYETYVEEGWTSKEAEQECEAVRAQAGWLMAEAGFLDYVFLRREFVERRMGIVTASRSNRWALPLVYLLTHTPTVGAELDKLFREGRIDLWKQKELEAWGRWWTDEELVREISRQLNLDHFDKRVVEYARSRIYSRDWKLRQEGRQAHPFPVELPSVAENRLEHLARGELFVYAGTLTFPDYYSYTPRYPTNEEMRDIATGIRDEFLTIFLPLKQRAVYWFDPRRESGPNSYRELVRWELENLEVHAGDEQWETTLFPEVVAWLREKANKLWGAIHVLEPKYGELYRTYYKKEEQKRYKGYDRPVKVSSGNSHSPEVQAYHSVPGIPRPRSDMAAEVANHLVGLPNFQARCKIGQTNARPREHLIQTYDFPGIENDELARRLRQQSSEQYGRDRATVEQAIEERLRVKQAMVKEGDEPILREKRQSKSDSPNRPKRSSRTPADRA